MSRTICNGVLLAAIAFLVFLTVALQRNVLLPNYVFMPEMVDSVPYNSFAANDVFADGKTLQLPVEGTVARGATLFEYEATEADAVRAGKELMSRWNEGGIEPDELLAAKNRGRKVFATFCLPCHGAVGNGDGPVTSRGFPPPPSLSLPNSLDMPDGRMFHVLTFGQKNMPGYAAQVSESDRWKAILHVRALQEPARIAIQEEKELQAAIAKGKAVFDRLGCNKCHATSPDEVPLGPSLGKIAAVSTREQLLENVLLPNKTIAEGFLAQLFLMFDGTTVSGFVTSETPDQLTIRDTTGKEVVLLIDDIDDRQTLEISPMPKGLLDETPQEEVEVLLDFLKSLAIEPAEDATETQDRS